MIRHQFSTVSSFLKFIFPNNILGNKYLCVRFNSTATSSEAVEIPIAHRRPTSNYEKTPFDISSISEHLKETKQTHNTHKKKNL